ncbi:MAG: ribosome maturation factor RimP [Lactovum sp.]
MSEIPKIIEDFILPKLPTGFELVDVEWEKIAADFTLTLLIEKENEDLTIDETAELSEFISPLLDMIKPDPFPKEGYMLIVSSVGAERPLKKASDYEKVIGEYVYVRLYQKQEGQKEYLGDLVKFSDEYLTLSINIKGRSKEIDIPLSAVAKAQTIVKF